MRDGDRPARSGPARPSGASLPVVAVVLAGGTGSRLYPAGRAHRPKQFLSLLGADDASLLERTVSRAREVADEVVVVTRESYADGVAERAPDAEVLVEPVGRDTGPALLYATHRIEREYGDCVVLALPSDHLVGEGFAAAVGRGVDVAAAEDRLVTFGVKPTRPETGYGYVEAAADAPAGESDDPSRPGDSDGPSDSGTDEPDWLPVRSFHEKPDAETAEKYVEAGHYWNAGLFAWRPAVFLQAAAGSPMADLLDALRSPDADIAAAFESADPVSVDHAVFETWDEVAVVPVSFPWDDVGSWDALERVVDFDGAGTAGADEAGGVRADDAGNVEAGDVTVRTLDAADNVVAADGAHVSLVGVSDLAVVAWGDRVLVVPKSRAQDVKSLVRSLEERGEF